MQLQLLEDSVEERLERALSDSEKAEGENKEVDPEDSKASSWLSTFDLAN